MEDTGNYNYSGDGGQTELSAGTSNSGNIVKGPTTQTTTVNKSFRLNFTAEQTASLTEIYFRFKTNLQGEFIPGGLPYAGDESTFKISALHTD